MYRLSLVAFVALFIYSCGDAPSPTPKPRAFPKVEYPEKAYQQFEEDYCAFTFEYPKYAEFQQDKTFFDEAAPHECWFYIYFEDFDSRLYFSYAPIKNEADWEDLRGDAFDMADWHNKKASYIDEMLLKKAEGRLAWSVWANVEGAELIRHTKEIYRQVREWVILQPLSYEMIFLDTSP